jgi:hypothetical protein
MVNLTKTKRRVASDYFWTSVQLQEAMPLIHAHALKINERVDSINARYPDHYSTNGRIVAILLSHETCCPSVLR